MLSNVQIRLLHGVGYRSSGTFCLRDTAINCLGFRVCSHDEDVHRVKRQLLRSDTSVVVSQSKSPKDKDHRSPTKKRKKKKGGILEI